MTNDSAMKTILAAFEDPGHVATYADGPPRFVPGYADLHRMTGILLEERTGPSARVLVLGAGGGLELKALATAQPDWSFVGVDPSEAMLGLAAHTLAPFETRVELRKGYIDDAPDGPFDAATCLLTLHFLDVDERRRTLCEIRRRLRPGAPFVAAHSSFPQRDAQRARWLDRYGAFAVSSGADPEKVAKGRAMVEANLMLLAPEDDAALMVEAGFTDVEMFYAAFTWRGWVGYA